VADRAGGRLADMLAAILTASRSGRRRAPRGNFAGGGALILLSSSRIQVDSVWSMRRLRLPMTPSNGFSLRRTCGRLDEAQG